MNRLTAILFKGRRITEYFELSLVHRVSGQNRVTFEEYGHRKSSAMRTSQRIILHSAVQLRRYCVGMHI